jgi:hypothetical protein
MSSKVSNKPTTSLLKAQRQLSDHHDILDTHVDSMDILDVTT